MKHPRDKAVQLPMSGRWFYSLGEYSYSITVFIFLSFFVFFLTDVVGISPTIAGMIYLIGMIWDALTDPVIGHLSDTIRWKSGRRRTPFMKIAMAPMCISCILMFTIVDLGDTANTIYYAGMALLYYASATTFYISFQALGTEVTSDLDERASMNTIRAGVLSFACMLAAAGTTFLVSQFTNLFDSTFMGWLVTMIILCGSALIASVVCIKKTKPYEIVIDHQEEKETAKTSKEGFVKNNLAIFKNKTFVVVFFAMLTCCVGGYGSSSIIMYYMTYYVGLTQLEISLAYVFMGLAGLIPIPLVSYIMQKMERKNAYAVLMGCYLACFALLHFLPPENKIGFYCVFALWGFGFMALFAIIYTLIADATIVEEYMTGLQKGGVYYGSIQLGMKCGSGFMIWAAGTCFENAGYVANEVQTASSLQAINFMNSVVPGIMVLVSIVLMLLCYKIDRKKYNLMVESIELRNAGKPYPIIEGLVMGKGKIRIAEGFHHAPGAAEKSQEKGD